MKIIKISLIITAGLLACNTLVAQDLEPKIAKPLAVPVPATDNKPDPKLAGITAAPGSRNEKRSESELKVMETSSPAPQDTKDELVKPQRVPETKPLIRSASTLHGDQRVNVDGPPRVLPDPNTKVTAPPPVKAEMKKPVIVQQQPGHN